MSDYDIGDLVRLFTTFKDEAGDVADPDVVELTVLEPDGTVTPVSLEAHTPDTGYYAGLFEPMQYGLHWVRWQGSGAVTAAEEYTFSVARRHVPEPVGS